MKITTSVKTMLQTVCRIDKNSLLIGIAYNLIKQLMNVFYGVYFIRLILVGLETRKSIGHILIVLVVMFLIQLLFGRFEQYYKNVYFPVFQLKVECFVNEKIMRKANAIPYDRANSPESFDKYNRVIENSSKAIMQSYQAVCLVCGLAEAFVMILYYIVKVDIFAIALSAFPLLYSYFLAEKGEELKYGLNQKLSVFSRKKDYAKRAHYLREYAAEFRTTKIGRVVRDIHEEGAAGTEDMHRKEGRGIARISFIELFLGDAVSMVLPLVYVIVRMLYGASYFMGDFIGIAQAITIFSADVEWMLDTLLELKSASLYICDYQNYIEQEEPEGKREAEIDLRKDFCIRFEQVKYQYPGRKEEALKDVSVEIRSGEKIAVVGENGAGKTTFISLLVNLISGSSGRILLNDLDINSYDRDGLKSFFGVVCQDYQIYPVSVRDNLSVNGAIADVKIREAIRKTGLQDRIRDIDQVIGKEISDDGLVLSGGERQKLALARMIANDFPVVILDEPTSAVDALAERKINSIILDALKDTRRTLVFISHRLSTTKLVDRILVFEDGRIVEEGNHRELMEKKGLYSKLYHEQSNLYKGQGI